VLPMMIQQRRGTILNIASVAAQRFIPGAAAYAATKAGVVAWSRVLREEVRAEGVRVGVLVPGAVTRPSGTRSRKDRIGAGCCDPRTWRAPLFSW